MPVLSPTLDSINDAGNGETVDLEQFTASNWTFNHESGSASQSAWAFRRKISGAPSYEYWDNSTSSWSATEVKNSGSFQGAVFGSNKFTNGNVYNWSAKTWDDQDREGPYATDFTVIAQDPPTVSPTSPSGTVTDTSYPTVQWDRTLADGAEQTHYEVKIFDEATYTGGGFSVNSSTPFWTSGVVQSDALETIPDRPLTNITTFRAYVRIAQTGDQWSFWEHTEFTMDLDIPPPPDIVVTPDPENARVEILLSAAINLLTEQQADFEGANVEGWEREAGAALEISNDWANTGSQSLKLTMTMTYGTLKGQYDGQTYADLNNDYNTYGDLADAM